MALSGRENPTYDDQPGRLSAVCGLLIIDKRDIRRKRGKSGKPGWQWGSDGTAQPATCQRADGRHSRTDAKTPGTGGEARLCLT